MNNNFDEIDEMEYDIDTQAAETEMTTVLHIAILKQQLLIVVPLEFINHVLLYCYFLFLSIFF